jgi:hypothetical protein
MAGNLLVSAAGLCLIVLVLVRLIHLLTVNLKIYLLQRNEGRVVRI